MDIKPAEADVPTPDMLAKIGMTTNMIVSASTAKSGTMIRARFSLTAAEPLTFLNFFSMLLSGNLETPVGVTSDNQEGYNFIKNVVNLPKSCTTLKSPL